MREVARSRRQGRNYSPNEQWSVQASWASLNEPERLHSGVDFVRFTASATHNRRVRTGNWQTTMIWGRNKRKAPLLQDAAPLGGTAHVHDLNTTNISEFGASTTRLQSAVLVESGLDLRKRHRLFTRLEWAEKDELFRPSDRRHSIIYDILKWNIGYGFSILSNPDGRLTAGAALSLHRVPEDLSNVYGTSPRGYTFFLRFEL